MEFAKQVSTGVGAVSSVQAATFGLIVLMVHVPQNEMLPLQLP